MVRITKFGVATEFNSNSNENFKSNTLWTQKQMTIKIRYLMNIETICL